MYQNYFLAGIIALLEDPETDLKVSTVSILLYCWGYQLLIELREPAQAVFTKHQTNKKALCLR